MFPPLKKLLASGAEHRNSIGLFSLLEEAILLNSYWSILKYPLDKRIKWPSSPAS